MDNVDEHVEDEDEDSNFGFDDGFGRLAGFTFVDQEMRFDHQKGKSRET